MSVSFNKLKPSTTYNLNRMSFRCHLLRENKIFSEYNKTSKTLSEFNVNQRKEKLK